MSRRGESWHGRHDCCRPRLGVLAYPVTAMVQRECLFCSIAAGATPSVNVFEDRDTVVFLDHRPLFPGHCLLITKKHFATMSDLPDALLATAFVNVRMISEAVVSAMRAEGSFVAVNNRVSQSVSHFHVHIVPRRKDDGLRGFFWPRRKYASDPEMESVASAIRGAIAGRPR